MIGKTNIGNGSSLSFRGALLCITAPTGSTITLIKNNLIIKTLYPKDQHIFDDGTRAHWYYSVSPSNYGTWTVAATNGINTVTEIVSITRDGQNSSVNLDYFCGIKRIYNTSDPVQTREGASKNFTATASVGTAAGSSDFDAIYPWSGIERVTLDTGDVMVKIPKFAYRRFRDNDNYEHIQITSSADGDFAWHPAFLHNGVTTPQDYIYVGAYKTSSNNKSVSGASPTNSQTRATMRTNAAAKGSGWGLIDASTVSAIQMLIMVEFANNDVQSVIGAGCASSNAVIKTGSCDNVPNLTGRPAGTSNTVDVIWRGIEGFWGNIWEWFDGLNWNDGTYYVCNNQANYGDTTSTGYISLGYTGKTSWTKSYIKEMGYDAAAAAYMFPVTAGGSDSTYYCDGVWSSTGWCVAAHSGSIVTGAPCGLFTQSNALSASQSNSGYSSRLLYIPS